MLGVISRSVRGACSDERCADWGFRLVKETRVTGEMGRPATSDDELGSSSTAGAPVAVLPSRVATGSLTEPRLLLRSLYHPGLTLLPSGGCLHLRRSSSCFRHRRPDRIVQPQGRQSSRPRQLCSYLVNTRISFEIPPSSVDARARGDRLVRRRQVRRGCPSLLAGAQESCRR